RRVIWWSYSEPRDVDAPRRGIEMLQRDRGNAGGGQHVGCEYRPRSRLAARQRRIGQDLRRDAAHLAHRQRRCTAAVEKSLLQEVQAGDLRVIARVEPEPLRARTETQAAGAVAED